MSRRALVLITCVWSVAAGAPLAAAQSGAEATAAPAQPDRTDRARSLFQHGLQLAAEERWGEARDAFLAARALVERPNVVFNLASVLYRLDQLVEARRALDDFERIAEPDNTNRAEAQRLRTLVEPAIAVITLRVRPDAAQVAIDGETRVQRGGTRELQANPGDHRLVVSAEGFATRELRVRLRRGERMNMDVALEALPLPEPAAAATAPPRSAWTEPDEEPRDADGGLFSSPWFWVVTGVVVAAGAGVGIALAMGGETAEPYRGTTTMMVLEAP